MKVLDLFCGGGGAGVGYSQAGFEVVGVDIFPHRNYPFPLIQDTWNAAQVLERLSSGEFTLIHASPPCQGYSALSAIHREDHSYPDLIGPVRELLMKTGLPYVIENVPGSPLREPVRMCGSSFGLGVNCKDGQWRQLRRHRNFECSFEVPEYRCRHQGRAIGVYGGGPGVATHTIAGKLRVYQGTKAEKQAALGIDWEMTRDEINEAIPPAYTRHIANYVPVVRSQ